jgi:hypothetical protein
MPIVTCVFGTITRLVVPVGIPGQSGTLARDAAAKSSPSVIADVFPSHSHADKSSPVAIRFAALLRRIRRSAGKRVMSNAFLWNDSTRAVSSQGTWPRCDRKFSTASESPRQIAKALPNRPLAKELPLALMPRDRDLVHELHTVVRVATPRKVFH